MLFLPNAGTTQPTPDTLVKRDTNGAIASKGLKLSDDPGVDEEGVVRYSNQMLAFRDKTGWVNTAGDYAALGHAHDASAITSGQLSSDRLPDVINKPLSVAPDAPQAFFYFGSGDVANTNNDKLVLFHNNNNRRAIFRYDSNQGFRNFVVYAYGADETEIGTSTGTIKLLGTNLASGTATSSNSLIVENGLVVSII